MPGAKRPAPREDTVERAWRVISDAEEFGGWFGVRFDSPFVAGASLRGRIVEWIESRRSWEERFDRLEDHLLAESRTERK